MKSISKFALAASLGLAIALTFSCSSDDGDGGGVSSSSGGGEQGGGSSSSGGNQGGGSSSSVGGGITYGEPVNHGGEDYPTVTIGSQTWFAKNLNYEVGESVCYDNDLNNCGIYGRLYDWNTAKTACPNGWHLPSNAEWSALITAVGGSRGYAKLKAENGWNGNDNATNDYGFSALPGGRFFEESFRDVGDCGYWWSDSEDGSNRATVRLMCDGDIAGTSSPNKSNLISVRCVKD